jgi:hypothetical protein
MQLTADKKAVYGGQSCFPQVHDQWSNSVSQPPGPGNNYTGPREVLLEFVILVF